MSNSNNSGSGGINWRLVFGAIGAIATVAAFFGITNIHQLSSALSSGSPSPMPVASTDTAIPSPTCTSEYCGEVHFTETSAQFGVCNSGGCSMVGTFINQGTETGGATVTFNAYEYVPTGNSQGPWLASCSAVIPKASQQQVVSASCVAYTAALVQYHSSKTISMGWTVINPD